MACRQCKEQNPNRAAGAPPRPPDHRSLATSRAQRQHRAKDRRSATRQRRADADRSHYRNGVSAVTLEQAPDHWASPRSYGRIRSRYVQKGTPMWVAANLSPSSPKRFIALRASASDWAACENWPAAKAVYETVRLSTTAAKAARAVAAWVVEPVVIGRREGIGVKIGR